MSKRKKIILYICLPLGFIILSISFILLFFNIVINNEQKYYNKANWKVSRNDFYNEYYPSIKNYFNTYFKDLNINFTEKIEENYMYYLTYENKTFQTNFKFEVFDDMCKFECKSYIFYESNDYNYKDIEFIDVILSNFGKKAFFDYQIKNSIILDIFGENADKNPYNYYFDSAVGNLGCGWIFCEGKKLKLESSYVLMIDLSTILRESENFNQRLLN